MVIWAIITVVVAGGSFYVGSAHGQSVAKAATTAMRGQFAGGAGRPGGNRFGSGAGLVAGDVLSKDDTSLTVKMRDGSSKIVLYSGTTQVWKSVAGSAADVGVGATVTVQGMQNPDGSVTAQSIQIRPAMPKTVPASGGQGQ